MGRRISTAERAFDASSATSMEVNSTYFVNTTAGAVTLTLPTNKTPGDFLDITDAAGTFGSYNCIILTTTPTLVGGFSDNLTLNLDRVNIRLQYSAGRDNWLVTQIL